MAKKQEGRKYVLRGYIVRRSADRWVAICLKPYLVVEGRTLGEAMHRMQGLLHAYISDAGQDGTLDVFMGRRAPARYYARYALVQAQSAIHALGSVKPFTETCCVPQHA